MPSASLTELGINLTEHGVQADPAAVAMALLDLLRVKGWSTDDSQAASQWLEELAAEVIRSGHEQAYCPVLDALQERLEANVVAADSRKVAAALLGLAFDEDWMHHPEHMVDWFSRVAIEVAQTPR